MPTVTVAAALAWAQGPDVDPASSIAPRRMTIARGFARYLAGLDERTEVPPPGLIAGRRRWRPPFIYSPEDITTLTAQARCLHHPLLAATYETVIGLLAVTGLRIGEAIRLDHADLDRDDAVLTIRESKFGKTRMIPLAISPRSPHSRTTAAPETNSARILLRRVSLSPRLAPDSSTR